MTRRQELHNNVTFRNSTPTTVDIIKEVLLSLLLGTEVPGICTGLHGPILGVLRALHGLPHLLGEPVHSPDSLVTNIALQTGAEPCR